MKIANIVAPKRRKAPAGEYLLISQPMRMFPNIFKPGEEQGAKKKAKRAGGSSRSRTKPSGPPQGKFIGTTIR